MLFFSSIPSTTLQEIKDYKKIIDVRTPMEYARGHLKGARNVPLDQIETFKTQEKVYVICQSGARSKAAVKYLRKKGIDAINIKGGLNRYSY